MPGEVRKSHTPGLNVYPVLNSIFYLIKNVYTMLIKSSVKVKVTLDPVLTTSHSLGVSPSQAGRDDRGKFGRKDGKMNPHASSSNKDKRKNKNYMMMKHKIRRTKTKRSFQEKQVRYLRVVTSSSSQSMYPLQEVAAQMSCPVLRKLCSLLPSYQIYL